MNDITVRRLEMCVRVAGFLAIPPMVFGDGSQGPMLVTQFQRVVESIQGLIVKHSSNVAASQSGGRRSARKALLTALDRITRCAAGIAVARPGFGDNFRLVRKVNETELLICARRFAESAATLRSEFVSFEMAPDFVDDLNSKIKAFEQAMADHSVSRSGHVATKKLIINEMGKALDILAQLDPIVTNKLAGDHDLSSQWENVRHVERAWISKKPEPAKAGAPDSAAA